MVSKHEGGILSFNKYLLSTFCVPGTVLGSGGKAANRRGQNPAFRSYILVVVFLSVDCLGHL